MSTFKFRVLIDTADSQDVFRDILVSGSDNFESFYNIIMQAFSFSGDQLGSFYLSNDNWDKGHEITLMDMSTGKEDETPSVMRETQISAQVKGEGQKLILVYDFLRMWCFLIEVIEVNNTPIAQSEVTLSIGEAPAEDSKELDFSAAETTGGLDVGDDIDDIFSEFDEEGFEDLDSLGDEF